MQGQETESLTDEEAGEIKMSQSQYIIMESLVQ